MAGPPEGPPLTASFSNAPDEHDGSDFHIDLTFSEEPDIGFRDVKGALRVSGGSINRASRKTKGSNLGWKIKVRPSGTGSVTITLPETTDCNASGAICTENGRKLSHSTTETVQAPVGISIADAEVEEGAGAKVMFTISLSEPAHKRITADWATSDGTAQAGSDYQKTTGRVTFLKGHTSRDIDVAVDGRVAGRQINGEMGQQFALDFLQQLGGGYGQHPGQPSGQMMAAGTHDPRFGNNGMTSSLGPQNGIGMPMDASGMQGLHPGSAYDGGMGMGLGGDRLLGGSSFALNRATASGGVLSFWSRSAQSSFYGQGGALALNGDVRSTMFGADYSKGRMVTGVSLAHSRGLGSYAGVDSGRMTSAVTGLYPWIGYKANERVTVWTVAGYGAGGLLLNPGAGAPVETGLSMAMAAGGGRGEIVAGDNGFGLAFKADALWVGTRTDAASGASGNLEATRAGVTRLRTALEGSKSTTIGARMAFTPSVEIGIRQDGGDAEVGRGVDVGLGLVLADGVTGLAVDVRIRRLLVHQAEGFAESGMSISVSYDPSPKTPLGLTARVSPAWGGNAMSGADALWGRETMSGMGQDHLLGGEGNRLDTEMGYGLPIGTRFVGTRGSDWERRSTAATTASATGCRCSSKGG